MQAAVNAIKGVTNETETNFKKYTNDALYWTMDEQIQGYLKQVFAFHWKKKYRKLKVYKHESTVKSKVHNKCAVY